MCIYAITNKKYHKCAKYQNLYLFSSSNSPESGIGLSSQSLPSSDNKSELDGRESNSADDEEEAFDSEPLPIIGRCRALYPFEGENYVIQGSA